MRTFDVYKHPTQGFQAVKQGFSWPGLFFTVIWAFVKRLWGVGFGILGVLLILIIIESIFEQEGSEGGVLLMLLGQLLVYIVVGVKGNDWRRANLVTRGFRRIASLQAETPDAAIGSAAEQNSPDTNATQQVAPADAARPGG